MSETEEKLEERVAIAKNCNTAHEAILREEWDEAERFLETVLKQVRNEKDRSIEEGDSVE